MDLTLKYKGKDYNQLKKLTFDAHDDVGLFFNDKLENLTVVIYKNRKELDKKLNIKTEPWFVADATNGEISILHRDSFATESIHNPDEFLPTLKHEIAHLFIDKKTDNKAVPKWLDEGVAQYVSEKYKDIKHFIFVEKSFCEKLGTPKGWSDYSNFYAYDTASLFLVFLTEKYGFDKIIKLLSNLGKNYYYPDFAKRFESIFGSTVEKTEEDFVNKLNSR